MSDRGAGQPDPPRPSRDTARVVRGGRGFTVLAVGALVLGLTEAALVAWWLPTAVNPRMLWLAPLLAVGFLLAEQLAINIDVRGGVAWTVSLTEIPLVVGLLVAPFPVVLCAHVIAGVGTLLGRRVLDKALYNAGIMIIEIATAFTVAKGVDVALTPSGPPWVGAFFGALAVPLVSTLIALFGLYLLGRGMRLAAAVRLVPRILVVGLLNTSVGLVCYEVAVRTPWGWVLILLMLAGMAAMYRAYSGLMREQRDLETLSDVSLTVARSGHPAAPRPGDDPDNDPADEWRVIAERIRDQLNANRVVLRLRLNPQAGVRVVVAGEPLPEDAPRTDARAIREDILLQLPGSHVRYHRALDAAEDVREALERRGAHEALVVPLRGATQLLGAVEAHDRLSRWRGFGTSDIHLLHTLANHLATAVDNRRLLARLRHDAYHDPLTGLLNRPGFREAAADLVAQEPRSVVLRVDLDVLSTVSDALGQTWGDRMVVAAGRRLREALAPEHLLARLEGGSFAVLLVDATPEQAHEIAEKLRANLAMPYPVDRLTVEANAVVGYVVVEDEPDSAEDLDVDALLQRADVAVRAARSGSDPVRAYVPSMGQIFMRRFQLVTQFRQALETGQVRVHYQPKIALPSRQVLGAEALVRWRHPEFGPLDPDEFVPAVEATGLVDALTSFVMEQSLGRVREWLDRGLRMSAAVNLSVRNLADEEFPDRVAEALARYDVPPDLLTFELTESGVMSDPGRALPVLRRLHALGVVLAVDDFGTGYSSLAYLRQLPVDEVKIDKSFVLGMGTDLGDMAVVRAIVELGHSLGLTVVAEGVEDDAARDQLVAMGCDIAQGYLISRPLSEDRFEAWLQARTTRGKGARDETVLTLVH